MDSPIFPTPPVYDETDESVNEMNNERFILFNEIDLRAQRRAIEDKLTQYYKKCIDEEQYVVFNGNSACALKKVHKMKRQSDNIMDMKQGKNPYCFFTVNLKPEMNKEANLEDFDKEMKDFTSKCKYINGGQYIYSLEQRSEGSDPMEGLHAHILFEKKDNSPSKLQRAFNNRFFDKWVGTHAALDYKYISEANYQQKIAYVMGLKASPKMAKVDKDRIIKDSHNIPMYYSSGFESQISSELGRI